MFPDDVPVRLSIEFALRCSASTIKWEAYRNGGREAYRVDQRASGRTRTCFGCDARDESANQFGHFQCTYHLPPIFDNIGM